MAKSTASNIYIKELDITINKDNYYMPEPIKEEPKTALVVPFLLIPVMAFVAFMEIEIFGAILISGAIIAAIEKGLAGTLDHFAPIYDPHRLAFDLIKSKIFGQSENKDPNFNMPIEVIVDIIQQDFNLPIETNKEIIGATNLTEDN